MTATVTPQPCVVDRTYKLDQNRTALTGRVFLTGTQALTRMLVMQHKLDRSNGLRTAGYVSGYRGSPLAGVDTEMWRSQKLLTEHDITFLPAVNEDLAATAVMGTQQVGTDPGRKYDGVFAMWYGKGPGIDRAGDALRHGNAAGASRHGGVLLILGDDHAATSSSLPNASELSLMGWNIPIVHPASVDEYEEFGLWGWAASRYSGAWVGFKAISETVESGRSVPLKGLPAFQTPVDAPPDPSLLEYRTDDFVTTHVDIRLAAKLAALKEFARVNSIDRLVVPAPTATMGIVAVGKSFHDLMEVWHRLGVDVGELARLGVRLYKPGLTFPLDLDRAGDFCRGLKHVLVIEEKASVVERQLKDHIFNWPDRPTICGKLDLDGKPLVSWIGQLGPADLAQALRTWLETADPQLAQRIDLSSFVRPGVLSNEADTMRRLPYFCSGCPHNSSTKVPEGSKALGGIGCHAMATWMDRSTSGLTQMGGEGVDWVGRAPFTSMPHVFQNLGDGTYFHSGYLAIRQAIAAKANVTYKILFNDAVAMTGGQPVDGSIGVPQICTQVGSEGAERVVVVTDQPERYAGVSLPHGVKVHHRRELDAVQRELREIKGVTVLIYDQTCAAEKRRRRKKNEFPDPAKRMFINSAVCEGCGDCGVQSNCLSIAPLETEFGRKRQIEQSSCNKDYSCVEGHCPSFVTVLGGALRKGEAFAHENIESLASRLPIPALPGIDAPYDMMVAGVGGTGVITIGALLSMAAHLEGKGASVLDFTALAQKGGAVISHIRLAGNSEALHAVRLQWGRAKAVIVADMVVGVLPDVLGTVAPGGLTQVIANSYLQPLAEFTRAPDIDYRREALLAKLKHAAGDSNVDTFDAHAAAKSILGDAIGTNALLLGYAWQRGIVPVSLEALLRAIELNGVAVEANKKAFAVGRLAAHDPNWRLKLTTPAEVVVKLTRRRTLEQQIDTWRTFLCDYQDEKYAARYVEFVRKVEAAERALGGTRRFEFTESVARVLFKLMSYKDEYEVARLYARPQFMAELRAQFEGDFTLRFNLAPPLFARRNANGELVKQEFGSWMYTAFRLLSALRGLRGTPFDIMGYSTERKLERSLIGEYMHLVERLLEDLSEEKLPLAVQIAGLAEKIRGFGHVKKRNLHQYQRDLTALLEQYRGAAAALRPAMAA